MLSELLRAQMSGKPMLVCTTRTDVLAVISGLGIACFLLKQDKSMSVRQRDAAFFDMAMPGELGNRLFDGTGLPVWEVLSIDRFKFWFYPDNIEFINFIDTLSWGKAFVSLDLGDSLPVAIGYLARKRGADCIAVQTEPVRTLEMVDMAATLPFSGYRVYTDRDKEFLAALGIVENVSSSHIERAEKDYADKKELRENLRVPEPIVIFALLFDKRDERQCRTFLKMHKERGRRIIFWVHPIDARSSELVNKLLHEYRDMFLLMRDRAMLAACDKIISFRWDEHYCLDMPIPVTVFDPHGIRKSTMLTPEDTVVQGLIV